MIVAALRVKGMSAQADAAMRPGAVHVCTPRCSRPIGRRASPRRAAGILGRMHALLASILIPLGFALLRALTRERGAIDEPPGLVVHAGNAADCRAQVDLLADAGVAAWIEADAEGECRVLVDRDQAAEVPTLLRTPRSDADADLSRHPGAETAAS